MVKIQTVLEKLTPKKQAFIVDATIIIKLLTFYFHLCKYYRVEFIINQPKGMYKGVSMKLKTILPLLGLASMIVTVSSNAMEGAGGRVESREEGQTERQAKIAAALEEYINRLRQRLAVLPVTSVDVQPTLDRAWNFLSGRVQEIVKTNPNAGDLSQKIGELFDSFSRKLDSEVRETARKTGHTQEQKEALEVVKRSQDSLPKLRQIILVIFEGKTPEAVLARSAE
jgi:hypothetical protein